MESLSQKLANAESASLDGEFVKLDDKEVLIKHIKDADELAEKITKIKREQLLGVEILGNILGFAKKKGELNNLLSEIEKIGMVDILDNLQVHQDQTIYEKTIQILDTYFEIENA